MLFNIHKRKLSEFKIAAIVSNYNNDATKEFEFEKRETVSNDWALRKRYGNSRGK